MLNFKINWGIIRDCVFSALFVIIIIWNFLIQKELDFQDKELILYNDALASFSIENTKEHKHFKDALLFFYENHKQLSITNEALGEFILNHHEEYHNESTGH